ncbi:hypothetical protein B0J14DRAFT_661969 [Halenospora varia]|nr:hypothetical protein B0J14DRAFT_661969 [Halenospora varia]
MSRVGNCNFRNRKPEAPEWKGWEHEKKKAPKADDEATCTDGDVRHGDGHGRRIIIIIDISADEENGVCATRFVGGRKAAFEGRNNTPESSHSLLDSSISFLSQTALLEADQGQGLSRIAFPHHPNDPQGAKGPSIPSSELEQPSTLQPTLVPTTSASRPARQHASYHTEVTADIRNSTPRQSVYTGLRLAAAKGTQRDTQQGLHNLSAEKETRDRQTPQTARTAKTAKTAKTKVNRSADNFIPQAS